MTGYQTPRLVLVGDARGIVLGCGIPNAAIDSPRGTPYSAAKPYTTHDFGF
jgi:hypothetical protein